MDLNFDSDDEEIISLTGGPRQPAFQQPVFQQWRPTLNMPANGGYKKKRTNKNSKKYKNKNKNKNRKRQTNRVRKAK